MTKTIEWRLMALAMLGMCLMLLAGCTQSGPRYQSGPGASTGRMVLMASDTAANMGGVSSVQVTVDSVQVHSAENGWVTLTNTPKTYDLVALKSTGSLSLMADANLAPGAYDMAWLQISNVLVTDSSGTHQAKLPSGTLRLISDAQVSANQTTTISFDFAADQSLHVTGDGQYILAPVVTVESRDDATVDTSDEANVHLTGGSVRSRAQEGMDENGTVGLNIHIPADANLTIDSGGAIVIHAAGSGAANGRLVMAISDPAADMGTVSSVQVTVDSVRVHSAENGWVTLNSTTQTYDLLSLNASATTALLADANLSAGSYDQVWLDIASVVVTDANGSHMAKLPSGTLRFYIDTAVDANQTSSVVLSFAANDSLHVTGDGQYILSPVVQAESRQDDDVTVADHDHVFVNGGSVLARVTFGMDATGNMAIGVALPADANLTIEGDTIVVNPGIGPDAGSQAQANAGENASNESVDISWRLRTGVY